MFSSEAKGCISQPEFALPNSGKGQNDVQAHHAQYRYEGGISHLGCLHVLLITMETLENSWALRSFKPSARATGTI